MVATERDRTDEELHKRTLVRRIKEHYTGKFGTGWGADCFFSANGLLSLGDPLSAFQPTERGARLPDFHKARAGRRSVVKSSTFAYFSPQSDWNDVAGLRATHSDQLEGVKEQLELQPAIPSTEASLDQREIQGHRQTSVGELVSAASQLDPCDSLSQLSRQFSAAPDVHVPSAQAPETSIIQDAENGDAAAQATVVRILLSSFLEADGADGVAP